jgi:hypothetical protein
MISKLVAILLLAAPAAVTAPAAAAASSQTSPQAALDGLLSADRQFGSSKLGLVPAIERMLDETAIMPLPTGTFAQGKQAVLASLRSNPANASAKADWAPVRAGISADGTHGFTFGFMTISEAGKPDRPVKYLAYWVKRPDGWRVAAYKRAPRPEGPVSPALREPALPSKLVKPGSARPAHKASLIAAEKAFSDAAQKIGLGPAFEKFGSADAMFIGRDADFTYGSKTIGANMGTDPAAAPTWAADAGALVAPSGDLGVTWGYIHPKGPRRAEGPNVIAFFTVWRRPDPEQPWRYVAE